MSCLVRVWSETLNSCLMYHYIYENKELMTLELSQTFSLYTGTFKLTPLSVKEFSKTGITVFFLVLPKAVEPVHEKTNKLGSEQA